MKTTPIEIEYQSSVAPFETYRLTEKRYHQMISS